MESEKSRTPNYLEENNPITFDFYRLICYIFDLMPSLCETCPILEIIDTCCSSNPDTGATKIVRSKRTGETIEVCDNLGTDGGCEIYDERPEQCREYVCEEIYAQGLNYFGSANIDSSNSPDEPNTSGFSPRFRPLPIYGE